MSEIDLNELTKPFPPEALEQRKGAGGRSFTYVSTPAVIRRLNRACGNRWDWRVLGHEWRENLLICWGELTIPGLGTRTGYGVQQINAGGGEDLIKGASSDAMKKAATLFGVGLELYGADIEAGETPRPKGAPQQHPSDGRPRQTFSEHRGGPRYPAAERY